jgi:hypothetical protein
MTALALRARAVDALPDAQRTAIWLREFQGLSYPQVGATMSCPVGTVRNQSASAAAYLCVIERTLPPAARERGHRRNRHQNVMLVVETARHRVIVCALDVAWMLRIAINNHFRFCRTCLRNGVYRQLHQYSR